LQKREEELEEQYKKRNEIIQKEYEEGMKKIGKNGKKEKL
jgi:hypothetical protein